jgi:acetyl CoA:N6-hydroxylysine acetyl transferase
MTETLAGTCLADFTATLLGQTLEIKSAHSANQWNWDGQLLQTSNTTKLPATLAAIATALGQQQALKLQAPAAVMQQLLTLGIATQAEQNTLHIRAQSFWQWPDCWLPQALPPIPLQYQLSEGRRHPLRRPQPYGVVYRRFIPWLGQTLSFRVADIHDDLPHFHRWMNEPHVAEFWQEQGSLEAHRSYLEKIQQDPRTTPLIASLDDIPFGYFEVYWAKEDRIAPYYDVADFDRGWHVLIGEAAFRGKDFVCAWLPSISHYLFLDDCRTQRLVIEPRSDNSKMRRNLSRSGYALIKEFDFPHKRAVLGSLLRERFFAEQLWLPQ